MARVVPPTLQLLFDKSLCITSAVRTDMGVGAIVNLQSNDASKLWALPLYLHVVWNGPMQVGQQAMGRAVGR